MKKISLFIIYSMLAITLVTSCLGDTNQHITISNQPGVVMKSENQTKIQLKDSIFISSDQISGVDDGDCLLLKYNLNYGLDANADSGRHAGFFTVELIEAKGVAQYTTQKELDTVTMFPKNERIITDIQQRQAFILDRLFLYTTHKVDSFQQQNLFDLSYNAKNEPKIDENNRLVYNLYLRVFKMPNVEEQKTSNPDRLYINAFNLSDIATKEKAAGKDSVYLKIHYVRSFNKDTTAITDWASINYGLSLYPKR